MCGGGAVDAGFVFVIDPIVHSCNLGPDDVTEPTGFHGDHFEKPRAGDGLRQRMEGEPVFPGA